MVSFLEGLRPPGAQGHIPATMRRLQECPLFLDKMPVKSIR